MPLKPAPLNLKMYTGLIFGPVILHAKDTDDQPVDLTGWKVFAEVRKKPGSTVIMDLHPSFTDASQGEITIPKMTDEETYNIKTGDFYWDLIMEDPTGDRRGIYMAGSFGISTPITKPPEGI